MRILAIDWTDSNGSEGSFRFTFRFDIHLLNYMDAISFHNLSHLSRNLNIPCSENLSGFFGGKLSNVIFYVEQRVKNWNELPEQHLTSVIFY